MKTSAAILFAAVAATATGTASAAECTLAQAQLIESIGRGVDQTAACSKYSSAAASAGFSTQICSDSACLAVIRSSLTQYPTCTLGGIDIKAAVLLGLETCKDIANLPTTTRTPSTSSTTTTRTPSSGSTTTTTTTPTPTRTPSSGSSTTTTTLRTPTPTPATASSSETTSSPSVSPLLPGISGGGSTGANSAASPRSPAASTLLAATSMAVAVYAAFA